MRDRSYDDSRAEHFRNNPDYAIQYLNHILQEGEQGEILIVLRQLAKAFGGLQTVAEKSNLNKTQIYRTLSEAGNPEIRTVNAILKTMGFRLAVQRIDSPPAAKP